MERPELEKRSSELVSRAEVLKIQLDKLEQQLLEVLLFVIKYNFFLILHFKKFI